MTKVVVVVVVVVIVIIVIVVVGYLLVKLRQTQSSLQFTVKYYSKITTR